MVTITKVDPLIIINDGAIIRYNSKETVAAGFDIDNNLNANYNNEFNCPLTDFTIEGTQITSLDDFQTALTSLTT